MQLPGVEAVGVGVIAGEGVPSDAAVGAVVGVAVGEDVVVRVAATGARGRCSGRDSWAGHRLSLGLSLRREGD